MTYITKVALFSKGLLELSGELLFRGFLGLHFVDSLENFLLPCFNHHTSLNDLIENVVNLFHVEDQIELADVLEAGIQALDESLYQIQNSKLRLGRIDNEDEVESGVVAVDDLGT